MSKDINWEPKIGQKVEFLYDAINCYGHGHRKGDVATVDEVKRCEKCGVWHAGVGVNSLHKPTTIYECGECDAEWPRQKQVMFSAYFIRPIQSYPNAISEILSLYPISERIETDIENKETVNN